MGNNDHIVCEWDCVLGISVRSFATHELHRNINAVVCIRRDIATNVRQSINCAICYVWFCFVQDLEATRHSSEVKTW